MCIRMWQLGLDVECNFVSKTLMGIQCELTFKAAFKYGLDFKHLLTTLLSLSKSKHGLLCFLMFLRVTAVVMGPYKIVS